jgi:hypothetical protein
MAARIFHNGMGSSGNVPSSAHQRLSPSRVPCPGVGLAHNFGRKVGLIHRHNPQLGYPQIWTPPQLEPPTGDILNKGLISARHSEQSVRADALKDTVLPQATNREISPDLPFTLVRVVRQVSKSKQQDGKERHRISQHAFSRACRKA